MAKKRSKRKPRADGSVGRKSNGQFAKGHTYSVGNKSHTNEKAKELKAALFSAVTEKDIKAICKKMLSQAKNGDTHARKELFDRLWGRAIQEVDLGENTVKTLADIMALIGINSG